MEIPYSKLSEDVLQAIVEEYVLREGTDYGHSEYQLDKKVAQVYQQLEKGKVKVVYDEETESCTLITS